MKFIQIIFRAFKVHKIKYKIHPNEDAISSFYNGESFEAPISFFIFNMVSNGCSPIKGTNRCEYEIDVYRPYFQDRLTVFVECDKYCTPTLGSVIALLIESNLLKRLYPRNAWTEAEKKAALALTGTEEQYQKWHEEVRQKREKILSTLEELRKKSAQPEKSSGNVSEMAQKVTQTNEEIPEAPLEMSLSA